MKIGDVVEVTRLRLQPFYQGERCVVDSTVNHGTRKAPEWRYLVTSADRPASGWVYEEDIKPHKERG